MDKFEFKYSAPDEKERAEIKNIRSRYEDKTEFESKLERLRKLDGIVKNVPKAISISLGIIGVLIFGLGLSMILEFNMAMWGVIVAIIGVVPTVLAYPINKVALKALKGKYGEEILKITEELLGENK